MRKAIRKSLWVVMAMTGLAACNPQTAEIAALGSAQLGDNPTLTQGRYTAGGGLTVATELREMRGMTALCGVWSHSKKMPGLIKQVGPQVLSTAEVHVGGAVLFRGLQSLPEVIPRARYAGTDATCIVTTRPWQPAAHKVVIPKQTVFKRRRGGGKGGLIIDFIPGGGGAANTRQAAFGVPDSDVFAKRLSTTPGVAGGRYSIGGGLSVAVELQNAGGVTHVCGSWAESGPAPGAGLAVLAEGSVSMGGRVLIRDLRFMQQVKPKRSYGRANARCISSGFPYNPGDAARPLSISLPDKQLQTGVGPVRFVPGGPGA